jgi:ribosome biogenesis GTPase A
MSSAHAKFGQKKSKGRTAFQNIKEQIKVADLLFEVLDARLPKSSRHPESLALFGNKPRLVILAKQDLCDKTQLANFIDKLKQEPNTHVLALDLKTSKDKKQVIDLALKLTAAKHASQQKRGLLPRPIRACVIGLPNVGKSSFINWLIGRKKTNVGNRPGITRGPQWIRLHPQLELLDTPGILPPAAFEPIAKLKLALCNLLPTSHFDAEEVANYGLSLVAKKNLSAFKFYGNDFMQSQKALVDLALAKNCLIAGGKPDIMRAASMFINDFRLGNLGKYLLD